MSGFNRGQLKKLATPLDPSRVKTREQDGKSLSYIEGWFAIQEANRIFGFDGWDREMVHLERVFAQRHPERVACGYMARVRVRVRAQGMTILREGTGFGQASAALAGEAHERAFKAAETDATKRALATFGGRFGLLLYEKPAEAAAEAEPAQAGVAQKELVFPLAAEDGTAFAPRSAEGFCSGFRQLLEAVSTVEELLALKRLNAVSIDKLRDLPDLLTPRGEHYADVIARLITARVKILELRDRERAEREAAAEAAKPASYIPVPAYPLAEVRERLKTKSAEMERPATEARLTRRSQITGGFAIDKSALALPSERRLRSKAHLAFVASKLCLVCEQGPCHAHHITFAQPRGLSQKVSDEFTVPLCVVHHNALHASGDEMGFWRNLGIDPLSHARAFWLSSMGLNGADEKTASPGSGEPAHAG